MKQWFMMKITREEFDIEVDKFLTAEQRHLHNQFLLNMMHKCTDIVLPQSGKFEGQTTNFAIPEKQEVNAEMPLGMASEGLLYDHSAMLARMRYGAWEMGLEGSSSNAAQLLLMAMQNFLKNIVTAVVMKRKDFKRKKNGYIQKLGMPSINPWYSKIGNDILSDPFESLLVDENIEGYLVPNMRRSPEEVERETVSLRLMSKETVLAPVSLYDLIMTLKLYPSLVSSNFVNTVNVERIYARLRQPNCEI
ncbi:transcriptional adapter 1-like isoform X2 [Cimex lectularius]|nr:transcriptional adapter 1-like isoform X2 [Cimex lectularius]